MELQIGDVVDVYRNLRNGMFSIRKKGKVVAYSSYITLHDPKFIVSEAGRQRVLREKRKNVHAVVRGSFAGYDKQGLSQLNEGYYNPYEFAKFVNKKTGEEIGEANLAYLEENKIYYI